MKFHIQAKDLHIKIERPYSLGDQPAFELTVTEYELKGDYNQLIEGFQDVLKKLMPPDVPFSFDEVERSDAEIAAAALDKAAKNS
jgi:hypothetical protein